MTPGLWLSFRLESINAFHQYEILLLAERGIYESVQFAWGHIWQRWGWEFNPGPIDPTHDAIGPRANIKT